MAANRNPADEQPPVIYSLRADVGTREQCIAELERVTAELQRTREHLHAVKAVTEELLHILAHDVRTPLTIVLGQAQLIQRFAEKPDMVRDSANAVIASARKMNSMISDLVDSARQESGQLKLEKQPVDLMAFVNDLLRRSKRAIDVNRVKVEIAETLPPVSADPDRLESVLMHLLGNALKYSPPDTEVLIRASKTNRKVEVSVTDQGTGIAPQDLPHLFDRSYKAQGARGPEGFGLGLHVAKLLLESHGGRIWVESEPGKGNTFYFTMPTA